MVWIKCLFCLLKIIQKDNTKSYYLHHDVFKDLKDKDNSIYNIYDFKTYEIEIDFNHPKLYQNKLIELVNEVEKECPVGKAFGCVLGKDNTIGEGIVWTGLYDGSRYIFKTKGVKHSSTKVKTLVPVDIEKMNSIKEFVDYAVTENRLNQGVEQVFIIESIKPSIRMMGDFIRWGYNDVIKEELDTLLENNLEPKEVSKSISVVARDWFKIYLDKLIFGE